MTALVNALSTVQALLLALAIVGCATAATITGHLTGTELLGVFAGLGVIGGGVTTAHVVGTQINTAAGSSPQPAQSPSVVAAPPAAAPVAAVPGA